MYKLTGSLYLHCLNTVQWLLGIRLVAWELLGMIVLRMYIREKRCMKVHWNCKIADT